jgi:hypothetical protein
MSSYHDDFADVDRWQDSYSPQQGGQLPGPEILQPGSYTFEILDAELGKTTKQPESIFRLQLRVIGGPADGATIVRPTFFRRQESLDYLGGELMTLGLPADQWGKRGTSWSQELRDACLSLKGLRFAGNVVKNKEFTNLYVNSLAGGRPMPGGPAPQPKPQPVPAVDDPNEIPF